SRWDKIDFHVDLGCGRVKKARIGVDRHPDPGVNVLCNFDAEYIVDPPESSEGRLSCSTALLFSTYREVAHGPLTYAVAREPGADAHLEDMWTAPGLPFPD